MCVTSRSLQGLPISHSELTSSHTIQSLNRMWDCSSSGIGSVPNLPLSRCPQSTQRLLIILLKCSTASLKRAYHLTPYLLISTLHRVSERVPRTCNPLLA